MSIMASNSPLYMSIVASPSGKTLCLSHLYPGLLLADHLLAVPAQLAVVDCVASGGIDPVSGHLPGPLGRQIDNPCGSAICSAMVLDFHILNMNLVKVLI